MRIGRLTTHPNIKIMLCNAARRLAVAVSLAAVALISAPFVSPPQRESERLPRTEPPKTQSRIGVTLCSGDTLLGVLRRFGVETPSAHALLEKVRPLMNVRKIQPGNDVHVVLDSKSNAVKAMELVVDSNLRGVKATDAGWFAERQEILWVTKSRLVRGTINGGVYGAGSAAG